MSMKRDQPPRHGKGSASAQDAGANMSHSETELSFEDFVRNALTVNKQTMETLNLKLDSVLAHQSHLESRITSLEPLVAQNVDKIEEIERSLEFQSSRTDDIDTATEVLSHDSSSSKKALESALQRIVKLEQDVLSLQRYTRSFNIRAAGIRESDGEDCRAKLEGILQEHFGFDSSAHIIENAHRIGPKPQGDKPRLVIARFFSRITRHQVMRKARENLTGSPYRFLDDHCPHDFQEKLRIQPYMAKLFQDNMRPRFSNGKLYSKGRPVAQRVIDAFLDANPGPNDNQ